MEARNTVNAQMFAQVKVDGQDFYTFSHRIPLERVCALHITGQVSIQSIKVLGVRQFKVLLWLQCWAL